METAKKSLFLKLRVSKIGLAILLCLHIAAIFCVLNIFLFSSLKIILIISIVIYGIYSTRHYFLQRNKNSIIMLTKLKNDEWYLHFKNGRMVSVQLVGQAVVTRYLIILRFKKPGHIFNFPLLLFADSESRDSLRKLRSELLNQ